MVGSVERLEVLPQEKVPWTWRNFNSVEFRVVTRYSVISSYTTADSVDAVYSV